MNTTLKGLALAALVMLLAMPAAADDGELFRKNVSKTPDDETHHASVMALPLYVPAQTSDGEILTDGIDYVAADGTVETRDEARPKIAVYEDGPVEHPPDAGGFYGHGERDMFAAVSLDDGATWKKTNLSRSAKRSSIRIDGKPYPGDVFRNYAVAADNKVLVVWASRYCSQGGPNYSLIDEDITAIFSGADISGLGGDGELTDAICTDDNADNDRTTVPTVCLYFEDYWGVAGSQGVADMADEGYPTVGELPYACLWAARGTLEQARDDNGSVIEDGYEIVWRQAERLTSGKRDVHRMEAACAPGAGCVITWQEDPDGLRPGEGEGPGEGWSGAIGHHQTDIWYSFIDWDNFDLVATSPDDPTPIPYAEYIGDNAPKAGVPFSIPVRLTDNAMCLEDDGLSPDLFCYIDFDPDAATDVVCTDTVTYTIETPIGTDDVQMCQAEDGRLMRGNTASTRARLALHPYDSDADDVPDRAWVVMAYEESKGLGDEDEEDEADKVDMGKNIWYHTFDMFTPELVSQGLMLNQPAVYPYEPDSSLLTGYELLAETVNYTADSGGDLYFVTVDPDPIYAPDGTALIDTVLYQTEIARRFSLISQGVGAAMASESKVAAFAMYKQGVIRRGGPADIMARRFILPDGFDPAVDNPYHYTNMECADEGGTSLWLIEPPEEPLTAAVDNPRYVKGLCGAPAINLSGTTAIACDETVTTGGCGYEEGYDDNAVVFPFDDLFADLEGGSVAKVYEWRQCDLEGSIEGCDNGEADINDPSWENPFDMAKGHRGFIKGDFIMAMYVWTPNWSANAVGHENANLYVRRSFDGGLTWTTLPGDFTMELPEGVVVTVDGTTHCEFYMDAADESEFALCSEYAAGAFEQARNVSLLDGTHLTVIDPRYTPTPPEELVCYDDATGGWVACGYTDYPYTDDYTDPSKFFTTFETGDTSGLADGGEAIPQDLFYARAVNFGDDYELASEDGTITLPDACNGDPDCEFSTFDWLEQDHDNHASEAAVVTNPGGTLFYAIWNQWQEDDDENVFNSDAGFRRTMELETTDLYTLPSGGGGGAPPEPPGPGGGGGGANRP